MWRVTEIKVDFAPDAAVNLANRMNAYVKREMPKVAPGLESLPLDPANPGRNAYADKAVEIAATPQAQSAIRLESSEEVRLRYMQIFSAQPQGTRPVRLVLTIKQLTDAGDGASIAAATRFVDAKTGQMLMEGPIASAMRQPRTAYVTSVAGLVAVVVVSAIMTAVENQVAPPFPGIVDQSAVGLKVWLLRSESE